MKRYTFTFEDVVYIVEESYETHGAILVPHIVITVPHIVIRPM